MNPMRSYLNLRFLSSTGPAIANTRKPQTGLLGALALSAAMLAPGTSVYPESRKANAAPPGNGSNLAPAISAEEAAARNRGVEFAMVIPDGEQTFHEPMLREPTSYYGVWTARPDVNEYLTDFVAYNKFTCKEISHGVWTEGSLGPKYGVVTQGLVKGVLANGKCHGKVFTAAGIYYKWVKHTGSDHDDEFKANWKGGGLTNAVTFYLILKK